MTDITPNAAGGYVSPHSTDEALKRVQARKRQNARFKGYGLAAIVLALLALVFLLSTLVVQGAGAFFAHQVQISVELKEDVIDPTGERNLEALAGANYYTLVKQSTYALFPDVTNRRDKRNLFEIMSIGAQDDLREAVLAAPSIIGSTVEVSVPVSDDADMYLKGHIQRDTPESQRRVSDQQMDWLDTLQEDGKITSAFNSRFFSTGDSREAELAGILGALVGSMFTMMVTLVLSFPIAVGAAIYLEEFAPKNQLTRLIEVNINNLAAVPSIVFGLLGLAIFINFFGLPRSAPLVGGMVLALMTVPTIIIATRAALKAVPPSIREGALGVGASKMQAVFHHVLPLAMPGILTGTILGLAQALGETAPLLMIGMVAFVVDIPGSVTDASTVLPVQIYLWADAAERAFVEKTSAAIMVLLAFLISMNALAIYLRKRFERRW